MRSNNADYNAACNKIIIFMDYLLHVALGCYYRPSVWELVNQFYGPETVVAAAAGALPPLAQVGRRRPPAERGIIRVG